MYLFEFKKLWVFLTIVFFLGSGQLPTYPLEPVPFSGKDSSGLSAAMALSALYVDTFPQVPYTSIWVYSNYSDVPISSLTPSSFTTIGELLSVTDWDFSANESGSYSVTTQVPISSAETCAYNACGFRNPDNNYYLRVDASSYSGMPIYFDGVNTYYTRAFIIGEAEPDEVFICMDGTTDHGEWAFLHYPHFDGSNYYMTVGDTWSRTLACKYDLFTSTTCGSGGMGAYADGYNKGDVITSGVVRLPSGHVLDALVVRTELYSDNYLTKVLGNCMVPVPGYEVIHLYQVSWIVPHLGFVAQIMSDFNVSDPNSWTNANQASFGIGLYPPLWISVVSITDTTVTISWNPGNNTTYIDGYKIYWDGIESGSVSNYDFNSDDNASQVIFTGTEATISGLDCNTTYYFTVTNRYTYLDPKSLIPTTYESIRYPVTVSGASIYTYPVEVTALTDPCVAPTLTPTTTPTLTPTLTATTASTTTPTPTWTLSPELTPSEIPVINSKISYLLVLGFVITLLLFYRNRNGGLFHE